MKKKKKKSQERIILWLLRSLQVAYGDTSLLIISGSEFQIRDAQFLTELSPSLVVFVFWHIGYIYRTEKWDKC